MEKPKKRRWWILVVIVIVIIICLLGGYVALLSFGGAAGQPAPTSPPLRTTVLIVTITNSAITNENGTSEFIVPKNKDLVLQSADGTSHSCKIAGNNTTKTVKFVESNPSPKFQLSAGSYKLTCDNLPRPSASIVAE